MPICQVLHCPETAATPLPVNDLDAPLLEAAICARHGKAIAGGEPWVCHIDGSSTFVLMGDDLPSRIAHWQIADTAGTSNEGPGMMLEVEVGEGETRRRMDVWVTAAEAKELGETLVGFSGRGKPGE